jgi:preprotein translocase subunit SecD
LLLVGIAVVVLIPTVVPYEQRPEIINRYFHRSLQPSVEIRGGYRLEYEVDTEAAIAMRVDSVGQALHQILNGRYPQLRFHIKRQGDTDLLISAPRVEPELSHRNLMQIAGDWLVEVERDQRSGLIFLRFDTTRTTEIREAALRKAVDDIEARLDWSRCCGEKVFRERDRVVFEIRCLPPGGFPRIKSFIEHKTPLRLFYEAPITPSADAGSPQP